MARNTPGSVSRWQIWNLNQSKSKSHTDPSQPTDSKHLRPFLIISDINHYKKVTCLPIQDLGSKAGISEVELLQSKYANLSKPCKVLCYEIYTVFESDFSHMICVLQDDDRLDVSEKIKRYLRL